MRMLERKYNEMIAGESDELTPKARNNDQSSLLFNQSIPRGSAAVSPATSGQMPSFQEMLSASMEKKSSSFDNLVNSVSPTSVEASNA